MSDLKYIKNLSIRKKDGGYTTVLGSRLILDAGAGMSVTADPTTKTVKLDKTKGESYVDAGMRQKYEAVLNGGSGSYKGLPYNFSGAPYYISYLQNNNFDGHVFLLGKQCAHWGLFEDALSNPDFTYPEHTVNGLGDTVQEYNTISITDVCAPCVDCGNYENLYMYMDAVKDAISLKKLKTYDYVEQQPTETDQYNFLALYEQVMLYWNNIVQKTAWRCNAIADGAELNAAFMFTNYFDEDVPADTEFSVMLVGLQAGSTPQGLIIDHSVPSGWVEGSDYELFTTPPEDDPAYSQQATWIQLDQHSIQIDTIPGSSYPPPALAPGDLVFIYSLSPGAAFDCSEAFEVISGDSSSFSIYIPEEINGSSLTGSLIWLIVTKLGIKLLSPLPPGYHIKMYVGAFLHSYKGKDSAVTVRFDNTVGDSFPTYPGTKRIITNKMVVIEARTDD